MTSADTLWSLHPVTACPLCRKVWSAPSEPVVTVTCCDTWTPLELIELDFRLRPGRRLREILVERGLDFGDFAQSCSPNSIRETAYGNLRRYTHPSVTRGLRWPMSTTVVRWAAVLMLEPGAFYLSE